MNSQQAACAIWPRAAAAYNMKNPLVVNTPILAINGDRDPATGLDWARLTVSRAPRARLVIARNRSHDLTTDQDECIRSLATQFVDSADPDSFDDACATSLLLPPFEFGGDPD